MTTLEELNTIFCNVFDDEDIVIARETTANDIDGWDSLSHMNLVVSIEKHYKVKFSTAEIMSWKNVGQMFDAINTKL